MMTDKPISDKELEYFRENFCSIPRDFTMSANFASQLVAKIDMLQAEIARLKALTQWQDIETAPKGDPENVFDLPEVDLFSGRVRFPNCFYDYERSQWRMRIRYLTKSGQRKTVFVGIKNPTHWKPLPQPPEVTP